MRVFCLLLSIVLLICVGSLNAETIHVPADQPTIQAGIDAAVDGDTVLVADGTYTGDGNRDIDFLGKAIVVMSENGPENCVIDVESSYPDGHVGFNFWNNEESTSVVQGFTITGGGNGIYCLSDATILDNIITENTVGLGAGIWCIDSSPIIRNNTIIENLAAMPMETAMGGGILCSGSSPIIIDNKIIGNHANGSGGGIYCSSGCPIISGNTINGNGADEWGGGICCFESSPIITDNTITGNMGHHGGGISCWESSPSITGNTISWNSGYGGSGIACNNASPTISDNTISENFNWAPFGGQGGGILCENNSSSFITGNIIKRNKSGVGGGIFCWESSPNITGNTITGNWGTWSGSGFSCDGGSPIITNSILWDNISDQISIYSGDPTVTFSDIQGGYSGEGNIDADPMFVQPDTSFYTDYRLLWESPCIDTGHPDSLDADGTRSDMGAYFFDQDDFLTLYITPDMTEVALGEVLGVTYTVINRWGQPERFWCLSQVLLPGGAALNVLGPSQHTLPASYTAQVHVNHPVPLATPAGVYEYWSRIGMPPDELYDEDSFTFKVTE